MGIEREKFLDTVADSFSAYYDLHMAEGERELPLVFRADYYSRAERYWLTKNIPIWGNETNEFAYVFSAPAFDQNLAARCIDYALDEALPMVKPHKEHQYTNVKTVFVADGFDNETIKLIKGRKFSKSYNFSLYGYTALLTAAVDMDRQRAFTNSAGHDQQKFFKKLFSLRKDSPD